MGIPHTSQIANAKQKLLGILIKKNKGKYVNNAARRGELALLHACNTRSSVCNTMKHLMAPKAVMSPILASSGNTFMVSACTPLKNVSRPCINTAVMTD